jgi:hypothetical protein
MKTFSNIDESRCIWRQIYMTYLSIVVFSVDVKYFKVFLNKSRITFQACHRIRKRSIFFCCGHDSKVWTISITCCSWTEKTTNNIQQFHSGGAYGHTSIHSSGCFLYFDSANAFTQPASQKVLLYITIGKNWPKMEFFDFFEKVSFSSVFVLRMSLMCSTTWQTWKEPREVWKSVNFGLFWPILVTFYEFKWGAVITSTAPCGLTSTNPSVLTSTMSRGLTSTQVSCGFTSTTVFCFHVDRDKKH